MLNRIALIGLLVVGAANVAAAQGQAQPAVNVSRLPIDLNRLQHDLRQSASTQSENHGLKITYRVDVYGQAPRIEIFNKEDNLTTTPAPYGAPTHRDMMDAVARTPDGRDPAYRQPQLMDFSSFLRWLADKTSRK
jgi:hypothetical protein